MTEDINDESDDDEYNGNNRNVTLRKSIKMHHGLSDVSKKGWIQEFDGSRTLNWWQLDSRCEEVGGHDGGTLPPDTFWGPRDEEKEMDIFLSLMCRRLSLYYEQETEHAGMRSFRYIPKINALGSHLDANDTR